MADRRTAQFTMQTEQRHQVDGGQRVGRDMIEVGQIGGIETGSVHQLGVQVLMDPIAAPTAVLIELDRHEGGFRQPRQPRDRQCVGVALLQVIHRAVHEVLLHLFPGALVTQVVGRAITVGGLPRNRIHLRCGSVIGCDVADVVPNGVEEDVLEACTQYGAAPDSIPTAD